MDENNRVVEYRQHMENYRTFRTLRRYQDAKAELELAILKCPVIEALSTLSVYWDEMCSKTSKPVAKMFSIFSR